METKKNKTILYINCPTCKSKTVWQENRYRPFCSERCKITDIGNWAAGKYSVSEPLSEDGQWIEADLDEQNDSKKYFDC